MDEDTRKQPARRSFFSGALQGTAGLGLGAALVPGLEAAPGGEKLFREGVGFRTGLKAARAIATGPGGRVCVAGDDRVHLYEANGELVGALLLERPVMAVAMGGDGRVYAGLADHIEVFSAAGEREAVWAAPGEGVALASLAVTEEGEVLAADGGNRVVWRFDAEGRVRERLTHEGGPFAVPRDFFPVTVVGGQVVVAHVGRHRIETIGAGGEVAKAWGGRSRELAGFGGCCNPISLAAVPGGGFVTAEGGLPRVKLFDAEGRLVAQVAGPEELEENARGSHERPGEVTACHRGGLEVAVDEGRRILVLDRVTSEVRIFA